MLLALFALGVAPLAGLLLRVWTRGGVVTGADGFLVADPMQYLTWLRDASDHVAVSNLYDLAPGPHSFVHPGVLDLRPAVRDRVRRGGGVPRLEAAGRPLAVRRRARARPAPPRAARRPAPGARDRAVLRVAARRARELGGDRAEPRQVRRGLRDRRAVAGHLPVGVSLHRSRRRPARARPARLRARPRGRRPWPARGCGSVRAVQRLDAALAGRDVHRGDRRDRADLPAPRPTHADAHRHRPRPRAAGGRRARPARLLLRALADGRLVEARRRGERLPPLAVVGHRDRTRAAGRAGRVRVPAARTRLRRRWRSACGRSRRS